MTFLYLLLLLAGAFGFALHLYAQWRFVRHLREHHPRQWAIIARPDEGRRSRMRTYARLQHVLRSEVPVLFDDAELLRWHRCWRYAPWLAWPCWMGVLAIQLLSR